MPCRCARSRTSVIALCERGRNIEVGRLELHPPGLDLGQVEDVVDERQQVPARRVDVAEVIVLLVVELAEHALPSSTSEKPMIALSGVRSSCDMLARNSDLCLLATSSWRLLSWISWNSRAFWIAITACSAKVLSSANCLIVKRPLKRAARPRVLNSAVPRTSSAPTASAGCPLDSDNSCAHRRVS